MSHQKSTILIVDDESTIRDMLAIELEDRYNVLKAGDADHAFEILGRHPVTMIISDINMPGIKGYELLSEVRHRYPGVKTALMTGYDIDNYIRMAKDHGISNIISKSIPFNFNEFNSIVDSLISEKIFGLRRYMGTDFVEIEDFILRQSSEIAAIEQKIMDHISSFYRSQVFVQILLEEIITNAVYHAPANGDGGTKYEKHSHVKLEEGEEVFIRLGKDADKYGVSVMDTSGRLTKDAVLYHIDRHVHGEGLLDESGRGIHMSRMYADRLIINIKKNSATEVIFINFFNDIFKGFKPLYIHEI